MGGWVKWLGRAQHPSKFQHQNTTIRFENFCFTVCIFLQVTHLLFPCGALIITIQSPSFVLSFRRSFCIWFVLFICSWAQSCAVCAGGLWRRRWSNTTQSKNRRTCLASRLEWFVIWDYLRGVDQTNLKPTASHYSDYYLRWFVGRKPTKVWVCI